MVAAVVAAVVVAAVVVAAGVVAAGMVAAVVAIPFRVLMEGKSMIEIRFV